MILGKCHYCRRPVYYVLERLEGAHGKCKRTHKSGVNKIVSKMRHACEFDWDLNSIEEEIRKIARSSYIKQKKINEHVFDGWELAVGELLQNGIPSKLVEKNLLAVLDHFAMPKEKIRKSEAYRNLKHLPFLRMVSAGRVPPTAPNAKELHFNLMNSEALLWVFAKVEYCEGIDRQILASHNELMRRGIGLSDSVLDHKDTVQRVDVGVVGITTKHLFFDGTSHRFRIPFHRIAFLEQESGGVNLVQDGQHPFPQQFRLIDTWFAYNLLVTLARK